jgi:hypothetical protein
MSAHSPQMAIADVLLLQDDLTLDQIIARASMQVTRQQAAQILFDAVRRGHVSRYFSAEPAGGHSEKPLAVYSLSMLGRQAAPLICSAEALLKRPSRMPRIQSASTVNVSKQVLRVLASAALESAKSLEAETRAAIEIALHKSAA